MTTDSPKPGPNTLSSTSSAAGRSIGLWFTTCLGKKVSHCRCLPPRFRKFLLRPLREVAEDNFRTAHFRTTRLSKVPDRPPENLSWTQSIDIRWRELFEWNFDGRCGTLFTGSEVDQIRNHVIFPDLDNVTLPLLYWRKG